MENEDFEQPDVTPMISINLILLCMTLVLASHAAKLLPMLVERAGETTFVEAKEAVKLIVAKDGSYVMAGKEGLDKAGLAAELNALGGGTVMVVLEAGGPFESLVSAMDVVTATKGMRASFGNLIGNPMKTARNSEGEED